MLEDRPTYNDEIDIFEVFQSLWDGKWLISSFAVLATLIGFGYSQAAQTKYNILVSYELNYVSPLNGEKFCKNTAQCFGTNLFNSGWTRVKNTSQSQLSLSTTTPLDVTEYQAQLERNNKIITNEIYEAAKADIILIKKEIEFFLTLLKKEPEIQFTIPTYHSNRLLLTERIIRSIDDGKNAATFGSVSVLKVFPKTSLILTLSFILGGMFGVAFIFIRNIIRNRKEKLNKV